MFHQWASVSTRQVNSLSDCDFEGSQPRVQREPTVANWWLVGRAKTGLVWIIKRTSYCAECYHDKIVGVFARLLGRHVSIIFSMEIIIFHYLPSRLATRERQSQTNLYLLRGAQCRAPLFEGDFVTTLHFIASNDQPRRQHWITSFPSCLWLPTDQLSPSFLSAF